MCTCATAALKVSACCASSRTETYFNRRLSTVENSGNIKPTVYLHQLSGRSTETVPLYFPSPLMPQDNSGDPFVSIPKIIQMQHACAWHVVASE